MTEHGPPRPQDLPTARSLKAATLAVGLTWVAAVVAATLAVATHNWGQAVMAFVAALNAAGWWMATRRWVFWAALAQVLLATLERHGVRYWLDEPPDG